MANNEIFAPVNFDQIADLEAHGGLLDLVIVGAAQGRRMERPSPAFVLRHHFDDDIAAFVAFVNDEL